MMDHARPKTILLVEDEALIAVRETKQLQKEGYAVITTYSGEEAIATAQAAAPPIDLILMDIDLGQGKMDGILAAQAILQAQDIPIVFLSSHIEPDIVARTEQITSYGYVVKGTGITVLVTSIKMAFKLHAAHQALRASEERLRLAHKATSDVVWDWDAIQDTEQWNEAGKAVFGWNEIVEHPVSAQWWVERIHPEDRQRVDAGLLKVVNNPAVNYWQDEYQFQKADGSYARVMDRGYVLRDASGRAVRMIGAMLDITERKRAEEVLAGEAIRRRILIEQSRDGIVILDQDGQVYEANQKFADMLGYPLEEMRKLNVLDWEYLYPPERVIEMIRTVDEKGDHFETMHRRRDGGLYHVEISTNAALFAGQKLIFCVCRDITTRKQVEEALQIKEWAIRSSINALALSDLGGNLIYINPVFLALWGYQSEQEVLGRSATGFWQVKENAEKVIAALQTQGGWTGEMAARRKDGSLFDVEVSASMVTDNADKPLCMMAAFVDITERKRAENALQASEKSYRELVDSISEPFFAMDNELRFIHWNAAMAEKFHIPAEKAIGKTLFQVLEGEWAEGAAEIYREVIRTRQKKVVFDEFFFDGKKQTSEITIYPFLGGVSAFFKDVTEQKHAEDALRESQRRYQLVFENSGTANSIFDTECRLIMQNSLSAQGLGTQPGEALGKSALEVFGPVRGPMVTERMKRVLASGISETFETEFDLPAGKKWFRSVYQPIFDEQGKVYGIQVISQDITAQKQAENALRQALAEKDVLMRELQHRVKNSLNIVASLVDLEEMNLADEQARAIFASTRSRIESISAVYEQLYHSGGIDQINLRHYILSLVEGLSRSYISRSGAVAIETQLDDTQFDLKRAMPLGIILNELVTNALKYAFPAGCAPDGAQGVIRVTLSSSEGSINLRVADNGVGLDAAKEHRIGTGLSLVEMLTQQLKGKLAIESTQGVTVQVTFDPW